jgi:hypothetical protein
MAEMLESLKAGRPGSWEAKKICLETGKTKN